MPSGHWSAEDAVERFKIPPASCGVLFLQGETDPFLREQDRKPYFEDQLLDVLVRTGIFTEVRKVSSVGGAETAGLEAPDRGWLLRFEGKDAGDLFNRGRPFCLTGHVLTFGVIPDFYREDDAWVYSLARIGELELEPRVFAIEGERGGLIGLLALVWGLLPNWTWGDAEAKTRERMAEHLATRVVQVVGEQREGRPPTSRGR